jgi:hypothetical protein
MATKKSYTFTRADEKKHSVVYKATIEEGVTFSIYVPKVTELTDSPKLVISLEPEVTAKPTAAKKPK